MKATAFCPISNRKIDEHVARLNGAFTLLFLGLFFATGHVSALFVLFVDFFLRSGKFFRYSLFSFFSRNITAAISLKPTLINAGPKIFASRIGLLFSLVLLVGFIFGATNTTLIVGAILGACAFLESVLGYCVACQVYPFVHKLFSAFQTREI
ncbi:MAG TPA: DUF4395 domain-containing protein [Paludibacter sp.]|nr:DUF4395 domain-containing protein [Paludibacter sp.]